MSEEALRKLLSTVSGRDLSHTGLDEDLKESLDLDSLTGLRMLAAVEKQLNLRFPDDKLDSFRTMNQILEFIHRDPSP